MRHKEIYHFYAAPRLLRVFCCCIIRKTFQKFQSGFRERISEAFHLMKKNLISALAFLLFGFAAVFAQTDKNAVSQLPQVEPFKISRGSSFTASAPRSNSPVSSQETITRDFSEALKIIRENHVSGARADLNELTKSSITSMLRALDPHSNYFDADEYRELLTDQRSEYFGIGATIANYRQNGEIETYVISTFPDSPAARAGLRFGDKILKVDGENMSGKTSSFVRDRVRGQKGTTARLTIERAADGKIEIIQLRRSRVPQPSIPDAYLLRQNIGYIDMTSGFNYTTGEELTAALDGLRAQGMNSLILDLRGNPGGILEQAVRAAEKFIPKGEVIVSQRGRFPIDNRAWKSTVSNPEKFPLVVLVDENSASAAEIVAGALQDYDRALVIGEKTFGKGLVQSIFNLPNNSGLTLTTARYFTPSGRSIQRDYENANLYDYFNHKTGANENEKRKSAAKTSAGREVYGGDGIEPDEIVKSVKLNKTQTNLLDAVFFFTREVSSGKLAGFENLRSNQPVKYGQRVRPHNFEVSREMFSAFKEFVLSRKNYNLSSEQIENEKTFVSSRIRYLLATANFGSVAANQVLIEEDPQILKAVEALPRAQQLAKTAENRRGGK
jgi:carboxyl-terminal processing protease